jgi:uncharacterized protein YabN with tetrapyrrole methylase and pyrophosphatase domain
MAPGVPAVPVPADGDVLGDLLLGMAVAARDAGVDAEEALRGAVARFTAEVRAVEAMAATDGVDLRDAEPGAVAAYRGRGTATTGHG